MHVSVIIPALNEAARIAAAVDSAWQDGVREVLVADGGSQDGTADAARARGAELIFSPPGRATQQNAAARVATGDVLLFLHADNRLGPACVAQVLDALGRDPQRLGGAFRQRIEHRHFKYRVLEWGNAWRVRWRGLPYGDQGLFFRRAAFEELGGFPEVRLLEDLLLMRQVRRRSWPLLLPGPLLVDARRWQRRGVLAQTLRNWSILTAYACGASPDNLATWYRRHDLDRDAAHRKQEGTADER